MAARSYLGIADRLPGEAAWSITFPDFPGVTSVAESAASIPLQARDALASAIEDMIAEGEALPPSVEDRSSWGDDQVFPKYDAADFHAPLVLLVEVTDPGRAVRVNISLDEGLHSRLKAQAARLGTTTSALLARGARLVLERGEEGACR